jgi:hypothetical protein
VGTVRLTVAQALVRFLANHYSERDGVERRMITGTFGIFGHRNVAGWGRRSMALRLARRSGLEAVELDASGDPGDAGPLFAGGEVAGFLGCARTGAVGSGADEQAGVEDLQQEGGQGQIKLVRGKSRP